MKRATDDVFRLKVPLLAQRCTKLQVSATANTGVYNGLMTEMKADGRQWLLIIHCVSHRIELAIKDSHLKLRHMLYSVATGNPTAVNQSFFASLNKNDERKVLDRTFSSIHSLHIS